MAFVPTLMAVTSARPAAVPAACRSAFTGVAVAGAAVRRPAAMTMNSIQEKIEEEVAKAKEASEKYGKTSKEAAAAWDVVEELEAEASHQKAMPKQDPLDKYCEDAPEADECRTYDN
ncbi:hypothetical protein MMPV_000401 [Pyropia vietnamensis]